MKSRIDALTVFLFGAIVGATLALVTPYLVRSVPAETLRNSSAAAPGAQPLYLKGPASAPVLLEEFGDFECPPCARLHAELKKIEAEYGTLLRIVFRHLPLPMHKHALEAARASEAAALQGRFWEMHDRLYESQNEWAEGCDVRQALTRYASALGLDVQRFTNDMDSEVVAERIRLDQQRAKSIDLAGTPSLFINGKQIPASSMNQQGIRAKIEAALNERAAK